MFVIFVSCSHSNYDLDIACWQTDDYIKANQRQTKCTLHYCALFLRLRVVNVFKVRDQGKSSSLRNPTSMQQTIYIALVKETTPPGLLSSAWFILKYRFTCKGNRDRSSFILTAFFETLVIAILGASSNSRLHAGWFQGIRGTYDVPACLANRYHIGSTSMSSDQWPSFGILILSNSTNGLFMFNADWIRRESLVCWQVDVSHQEQERILILGASKDHPNMLR